MKSEVLKTISKTILEHAGHEGEPDAMFLEIDTSVSETLNRFVPYLNVYSYRVFPESNLDEVIAYAVEKEDLGYVFDEMKGVASDTFRIDLHEIYPETIVDLDEGDKEIIDTVKETVNNNEEAFRHIKKLYFHYVSDTDFIRIIDLPV